MFSDHQVGGILTFGGKLNRRVGHGNKIGFRRRKFNPPESAFGAIPLKGNKTHVFQGEVLIFDEVTYKFFDIRGHELFTAF
jgi:hypothetical protein